MRKIKITKVLDPKETHDDDYDDEESKIDRPSWIIYELGKLHNPILLLTDKQMENLVVEYQRKSDSEGLSLNERLSLLAMSIEDTVSDFHLPGNEEITEALINIMKRGEELDFWQSPYYKKADLDRDNPSCCPF